MSSFCHFFFDMSHLSLLFTDKILDKKLLSNFMKLEDYLKNYKKPKACFCIVLLLVPAQKRQKKKAKEGETGTLFSSRVGRKKNVVYGTVTVLTKIGKKCRKKVLPFVESGCTRTEEQQHGGVGKKGILPGRVEMGTPC